MSKLFPASICVLTLSLAAGFAAEPRTLAPTEAVTPHSPVSSNPDKPDQIVEHLLKAAEHLEAAGFVEESAKIRDDARLRALRDDVLSRKQAELECLQEEVDRLRVLTGQVPVLLIEIVAIEVDRAQLGLKTRDFDKLVGLSPAEPAVVSATLSGQTASSKLSSAGASIVEADPWRLPLLRELREKGAVKLLAHPTVQTTTHRPASVLIGGEVPVRVKTATGEVSIRAMPFGTRVEVRAVVLPNQRIRLQAAVELTKVGAAGVIDDDGTAYPGTSSRRFNTEVEMRLGQTLAAGRLVCDRPADDAPGDAKKLPTGTIRQVANAFAPSESVETVVFITPRLVQDVDTLLPMPIDPTTSERAPDEVDDFTPTNSDVLGPPVPVFKRRTTGRE